jgi:hypothetical protein
MGNNKEMGLIARVIPDLVRSSRGNPNPHAYGQNYQTAIHFHDDLAREHVEELLSVMVEVANFCSARWHALMNYAKLRILHQVPAITAVAPDVMLSA